MELEITKVRLPSGKEIGIIEALNFCYDISDTDFQVLKVLLSGEGKNEDALAEMLKLSKASINRSVNKLVSLGFIEKVKDTTTKGGRPRYIYKAIPIEKLVNKIVEDFKKCADLFAQILPKELGKREQKG